MDGDLILIFGFVLVILITMLTFGTVAGNRSRAHKLQRLEIEARIAEAKAREIAKGNGDYSKLEERLRVLERLATDRGILLSDEIEALRDARVEPSREKEAH